MFVNGQGTLEAHVVDEFPEQTLVGLEENSTTKFQGSKQSHGWPRQDVRCS